MEPGMVEGNSAVLYVQATGSSGFHHTVYSITWTWCCVFIQIISYVMPVQVTLQSKALVCSGVLKSWVQIPPRAWCSSVVNVVCCQVITCSEESCQLWWIIVSDLETPRLRRLWPALGQSATHPKNKKYKIVVLV